MKEENLKKKNIRNILFGSFFITLSGVLLSFFLPYYLKERGLSILEIGALFSIGLAIGSLFFSLIFSKILKKVTLRTGLILSSVLKFVESFFMYISPTSFGSLGYKFINKAEVSIGGISTDVALQHNILKKEERKISSLLLVTSSFAMFFGLCLSLFLVKSIGFRNSFLVFALFSIISLFFYKNVCDGTRFKLREKIKLSNISNKLKLVLFSELIYWFILSSSFGLVVTFLVTNRFSESISWIAYLFAGLYLSLTLTTFLTRKFFEERDLIKSSILGMFILFLSAVLIIFSTSLPVVLMAFILEGIGAGIWTPSKVAIQWKLTSKENRERVSGYLTGARGFVSTLGPLFGSVLVISLGILSPFYFKAGICLIVIGIYFYVLKN